VGEEGQEGGEGAESGREEDEEGQLFLGVDRHLVVAGQELPVGALGAARVGVEEVSLLQRVGDEAEGALPGALQEVARPLHSLPMDQVVKCIGNGLAVSPLENVLRRQYQRPQLQQVGRHVRVELDGPMDGLHRRHLGAGEAALAGDVGRELVGHRSGLQQGRRVADGGRLGQREVVVLGQHSLHVGVVAHLQQSF